MAVGTDLLALTIVTPPGEAGADVVVDVVLGYPSMPEAATRLLTSPRSTFATR